MAECRAVLNYRGEHFNCDWPTDENGRHDGWGHSNKAAEALWLGADESAPAVNPDMRDTLL